MTWRCKNRVLVPHPHEFGGEDITGWDDRPLSIVSAASQVRTCQQAELAREHLARLRRQAQTLLVEPVPYGKVAGTGFYQQFLNTREWPEFMRAGREAMLTLAASLMRRRLVMSDGMRSPRILAVSRGRMEVEGIGAGEDFKLYPGGGRERDWNETGTRHSPGIQPADAEKLLAHGATAVVLSPGVSRRFQVDLRTLDYLAGRWIAAHAAKTC